MAKPMNCKRRLRALETRGPGKTRNPVVLGMLERGGQGRHPNFKKEQARKACRGKVAFDA